MSIATTGWLQFRWSTPQRPPPTLDPQGTTVATVAFVGAFVWVFLGGFVGFGFSLCFFGLWILFFFVFVWFF